MFFTILPPSDKSENQFNVCAYDTRLVTYNASNEPTLITIFTKTLLSQYHSLSRRVYDWIAALAMRSCNGGPLDCCTGVGLQLRGEGLRG
jgi:hypothetical protein